MEQTEECGYTPMKFVKGQLVPTCEPCQRDKGTCFHRKHERKISTNEAITARTEIVVSNPQAPDEHTSKDI